MQPFVLPPLPTFSKEKWAEAKRTKDYRPILFDLYGYVGLVTITCAEIHPSSADIRPIPELNRAVLTGLLCRCCRLMLASIKLSDEDRFGETLAILQRCIAESAFRVRWLCKKNDQTYFNRYIADGLKAEVALRDQITTNIKIRGGQIFPIEKRMLDSTGRMLEESGMTEEQVSSTKEMPKFNTICTDIDLGDLYLVVQKLGSHSIHGNWSDILMYYVSKQEDGSFALQDHDAPPHANQYLYPSLFVLSATKDYLNYIAGHKWTIDNLAPELLQVEQLLWKIAHEQSVGDNTVESNTTQKAAMGTLYSFSVSESEYHKLQKLCPSDFPFDYKTFTQREQEGIASMATEGMCLTPVKVNVDEFAEWCKKSKCPTDGNARCAYAIEMGRHQ